MEQALIDKAFEFNFLIGFLTVFNILLVLAIIMMWRYITHTFSEMVSEFKDALQEFTNTLHEIKGSIKK